jgi:hypothetical protein
MILDIPVEIRTGQLQKSGKKCDCLSYVARFWSVIRSFLALSEILFTENDQDNINLNTIKENIVSLVM